MKRALVALALLAAPAAADTFSGSFTFDTTLTPSSPAPGQYSLVGGFDPMVVGHVAAIGAITATMGGVTLNLFSVKAIGADDGIWSLAASHTGAFPGGMGIYLAGADTVATSILPLALEDYSTRLFNADFPLYITGPFRYSGVLDELTQTGAGSFSFAGHSVDVAASVPEPATWALMLFAFGFFALKGIWPRR